MKDELGVMSIMSTAIEAFEKAASASLRPLLLETYITSGKSAARALKRAQGLRTAAVAQGDKPTWETFAFDVTNPKATEWARKRAADLISGMTATDRDEIRELVEEAFDEQFDVDELAGRIEEIVGDRDRADLIARTETMTASNAGQVGAWEQAIDEGLLTGLEGKEWITTPDDRLCPVCEPMDGVVVAFNEDFDTEDGRVSYPPAHPNCRCTVGLSAIGAGDVADTREVVIEPDITDEMELPDEDDDLPEFDENALPPDDEGDAPAEGDSQRNPLAPAEVELTGNYDDDSDALQEWVADNFPPEVSEALDEVTKDSKGKLTVVPIEQVISTQPTISRDIVERYKDTFDVTKEAGIVVQYGDQYILIDGNHRVVAAFERGDRTVKVRVVRKIEADE